MGVCPPLDKSSGGGEALLTLRIHPRNREGARKGRNRPVERRSPPPKPQGSQRPATGLLCGFLQHADAGRATRPAKPSRPAPGRGHETTQARLDIARGGSGRRPGHPSRLASCKTGIFPPPDPPPAWAIVTSLPTDAPCSEVPQLRCSTPGEWKRNTGSPFPCLTPEALQRLP